MAIDTTVDLSTEITVSPTVTTPPSYSIIFDNLDFYMKVHHQSSLHTNKSIHWINHTAVEDRIPINHLSDKKPVTSITEYNLVHSLPGLDTQKEIRREFTVLGSRILTQYLGAFKTFAKVVVNHIPHQYSTEMSECSIDASIKIHIYIIL